MSTSPYLLKSPCWALTVPPHPKELPGGLYAVSAEQLVFNHHEGTRRVYLVVFTELDYATAFASLTPEAALKPIPINTPEQLRGLLLQIKEARGPVGVVADMSATFVGHHIEFESFFPEQP